MGSGKSAVGKILASRIGVQFIDLDSFIESHEGISISEIFSSRGEVYFRKKEGELIEYIVTTNTEFVLSTGGGTPCYGSNMNFIKEHTISFYLKASIPTLSGRLRSEQHTRPLIASFNSEELNEFVAKHLFERRAFYEQADFIQVVNDKSIEEIADEISRLFK